VPQAIVVALTLGQVVSLAVRKTLRAWTPAPRDQSKTDAKRDTISDADAADRTWWPNLLGLHLL
jgi:hypothetical protein